jgi:hypothetical protein
MQLSLARVRSKWHCMALLLDMFAVSLFSAVMLYIINGDEVPLWGVASDDTVRSVCACVRRPPVNGHSARRSQ